MHDILMHAFSCNELDSLIYTRVHTELAIIKIGNIRQISLAMLIKRILTKTPYFIFINSALFCSLPIKDLERGLYDS